MGECRKNLNENDQRRSVRLGVVDAVGILMGQALVAAVLGFAASSGICIILDIKDGVNFKVIWGLTSYLVLMILARV